MKIEIGVNGRGIVITTGRKEEEKLSKRWKEGVEFRKTLYGGYTEGFEGMKRGMKKTGDDLLEKLAELEHEQWCHWSKSIAEREDLGKERLEHWKRLWIPYSELREDQKAQDRAWARKAIRIVGEYILEVK